MGETAETCLFEGVIRSCDVLTFHSPHSTLLTPHFSLYTLRSTHSTIYTPHYTLHLTFHTLHTTLYVFLLFYPLSDLHWGLLVLLVFSVSESASLGIPWAPGHVAGKRLAFIGHRGSDAVLRTLAAEPWDAHAAEFGEDRGLAGGRTNLSRPRRSCSGRDGRNSRSGRPN